MPSASATDRNDDASTPWSATIRIISSRICVRRSAPLRYPPRRGGAASSSAGWVIPPTYRWKLPLEGFFREARGDRCGPFRLTGRPARRPSGSGVVGLRVAVRVDHVLVDRGRGAADE